MKFSSSSIICTLFIILREKTKIVIPTGFDFTMLMYRDELLLYKTTITS